MESNTINASFKIEVTLDEESKKKFDSIGKNFESTIGFKASDEQLFLFIVNTMHKTIFGPSFLQSMQQGFNQPPIWSNPPPNTFERNK